MFFSFQIKFLHFYFLSIIALTPCPTQGLIPPTELALGAPIAIAPAFAAIASLAAIAHTAAVLAVKHALAAMAVIIGPIRKGKPSRSFFLHIRFTFFVRMTLSDVRLKLFLFFLSFFRFLR